MICEVCGKQFRPSGKGSQQKYCSAKCRQKDYRRRKKNRPAQDRNSKPPVKAVETKQKPEQDLDQRSFERMMDGSMLDILRDNRDLLLKAMADPTTPANALPAISRQLIAVCDRIESLQVGGLTDLLDEIPVDACRWFFNAKPETQMEFDLGLAVREDSENPVYYVQYAHARICSILKKMESEGVQFAGAEQVDATLLTEPSEMDLIRMLAAFPQEIVMAAEKYDPSRINRFVIDLASAFHRFYGSCRIQGADPALQQARLALCIGVKNAIFNVLTMFKINVPEKM